MTAAGPAADAARSAVLTAAVLKVVAGKLAEVDKATRADLASVHMGPGDRMVVRSPDGPQIKGATVTIREAAVSAYVDDPAALLAWVAGRFPTEVEEIPATHRVRPAFLGVLLAAAKEAGDPVWEDGEVVDGIAVEVGRPVAAVSISPEAAVEVLEHLRAGRVTLASLLDRPALPGPGVAS